jgi:streptomycin 6-kinase
VDQALACIDAQIDAFDPSRAVLVYGDVHQWNALAGADGYRLVDPDGARRARV